MDKKLKIGLYLMVVAVIVIPFGLIVKSVNPTVSLVLLILAMFLELAGLIFVILNILDRRKI